MTKDGESRRKSFRSCAKRTSDLRKLSSNQVVRTGKVYV